MSRVVAFLVGLLVAMGLVACGDDPRGTPPEWRITTTLPGQHLGQTGTPRLPPPTAPL